MKKESPPAKDIIDIKEEMAGAMLVWIMPVFGVAFAVALCSQIVTADKFIRMMPTISAFYFFFMHFSITGTENICWPLDC